MTRGSGWERWNRRLDARWTARQSELPPVDRAALHRRPSRRRVTLGLIATVLTIAVVWWLVGPTAAIAYAVLAVVLNTAGWLGVRYLRRKYPTDPPS